MEVTSTPSSPSAGLSQSGKTDIGKINSDYSTFLKMLTAQISNQDPLNPMKSEDFATQLATFSGVEQQVKTNDLLKFLGAQIGLMSMGQMASWIGLEARAASPAYFDGTPISISPNPAATADQAVLVVYDENGNEIQRQSFAPTTEEIQWAGVSDSGAPFENGLYRFEIESYSGDELIATTKAEVYSKITEAKSQNGETILVLEGGAEIPASAVSGLRDPV